MTELEKLKIRLNITDDIHDDLLNLLIEDAKNEILDYTNRIEINDNMNGLVRELAIIYYNRQQDEGIASRSEGRVRVSYTTEKKKKKKNRLNAYRINKYCTFIKRKQKENENQE